MVGVRHGVEAYLIVASGLIGGGQVRGVAELLNGAGGVGSRLEVEAIHHMEVRLSGVLVLHHFKHIADAATILRAIKKLCDVAIEQFELDVKFDGGQLEGAEGLADKGGGVAVLVIKSAATHYGVGVERVDGEGFVEVSPRRVRHAEVIVGVGDEAC